MSNFICIELIAFFKTKPTPKQIIKMYLWKFVCAIETRGLFLDQIFGAAVDLSKNEEKKIKNNICPFLKLLLHANEYCIYNNCSS